MKIKIYYHNCELEGSLELEVDAKSSERDKIIEIIQKQKTENPFQTSAYFFIEKLKEYNINATQIPYDIRIR